MAQQRFIIFFRNTLAQWLKAWAKRLEPDTPDAADKDGAAGNGTVAGQADEPPAHWLEQVNRHQQPPAHWLAHVHARPYVRIKAPDAEQPPGAALPAEHLPATQTPDAASPAEHLPATQTPEPAPPPAGERKPAGPQPRSPLHLIPRTQPAQEEMAKAAKAEEPRAQAKKPSPGRVKAPESTSPQKRQMQEKSRTTTLRLEPQPGTERVTAPSGESSPESAATLPSAMTHNLEPRQRNERAEPKRATEPDSRVLKDEDAIKPIPQPQPGPADLWPRRPSPQPVSQPSQAPRVLETTQWVRLESKYTPAAAYTSATPVVSPDRPPSSKVEQRLPERAIEEDNAVAVIFQPRSVSKEESRVRPQEQGGEKDHWPELPAESLGEDVADGTAEAWEAHLRAWQRRQKLDREQRGILWNELPS